MNILVVEILYILYIIVSIYDEGNSLWVRNKVNKLANNTCNL